jgi:hypothetical protein
MPLPWAPCRSQKHPVAISHAADPVAGGPVAAFDFSLGSPFDEIEVIAFVPVPFVRVPGQDHGVVTANP